MPSKKSDSEFRRFIAQIQSLDCLKHCKTKETSLRGELLERPPAGYKENISIGITAGQHLILLLIRRITLMFI